MENPATWNKVEKAINQAMDEHRDAIREERIGHSLQRLIYLKLKEKGFLRESLT